MVHKQQNTKCITELISREIAGYYLAPNGSDEISNVYVAKYKNNKIDKSYGGFRLANMNKALDDETYPHTNFHTHPSIGYSETDRKTPSKPDRSRRESDSKLGVKKFIILTRGFDPTDYTNAN